MHKVSVIRFGTERGLSGPEELLANKRNTVCLAAAAAPDQAVLTKLTVSRML